MRKTEIYHMGSPYREDLSISGYTLSWGVCGEMKYSSSMSARRS